MITEGCFCSNDIPGVEQLPVHQHRAWARIRHDGHEIMMNERDALLNLGNEHMEILEFGEDVSFWVDWRAYGRAMALDQAGVVPSSTDG